VAVVAAWPSYFRWSWYGCDYYHKFSPIPGEMYIIPFPYFQAKKNGNITLPSVKQEIQVSRRHERRLCK
jgi:hypothetical protein